MELEEEAQELLETLWINNEEQRDEPPLSNTLTQNAVEQLRQAGYIEISNNNRVNLTQQGRPEAANVVRRHRLAERLLADVLGTREGLMHDKACKFEHLLDRGLDESICILLGHPKVCPHGKPIPPGRCCQQGEGQPHKLVSPLSQLLPGQRGRVAYIYAPESSKLQKLIAMGIYPGAPVNLIQSFPSYVFESGQTQFAVDREIADAIYIRLVEEQSEIAPEQRQRRRWGLRRGFGR